MAITPNLQGTPLKYNKNEYLEKFIPLVLEIAPKYEMFSIYGIKNDLNLSEKDKRILVDLSFDIRTYLIDNGLAILKGSNKLLLTENKYKPDIIMNDNSVNNDFRNSTIGQVNQSSDKIVVKKNKIQHIDQPTKKASIWATIKSSCVKFWWAFIIPLVATIIGILIERDIIDIGL